MSWILPTPESPMAEPGFWEPHSSSVDFCEPNYQLSKYIAEPHNALSSLFISLVGLIGMLYSNPLGEWPFTILFGHLFLIGLGSFALHSSLHWAFQSTDELPMLWFTLWAIYSQTGFKNRKPYNPFGSTAIAFAVLNVIATVGYFLLQHNYIVFVVAYSIATFILIGWNFLIVLRKPFKLLRRVFFISGFFFVWLGVGVWLIDMHYCEHLLGHYRSIGGWTIHVLWHLCSGIGGYFQILTLIVARAHFMGKKVAMKLQFGFLPVIVMASDSAKKK